MTFRCFLRSKTPGFTLLEVLVAFSLLSLLLSIIVQSQSETAFFLEKTGKLEKVQREVINELLIAERGSSADAFVSGSGTFPPDHPLAGDRWQKEILTIDFLLGLIEVKKLVYRITWDAGRGAGEQSFESAILKEIQ